MQTIEQYNHQQQDQNPEPFEYHASGPVTSLDWPHTVLVLTRRPENRLIYRSGSAYFTMVTKSTNAWYFGDHRLTKSWYVCNVTQLYVWDYFKYENKNYDSRDRKNCDEKSFNCGFWFDQRSQLLSFIDVISVLNWLNSIYSLFWVEG